jgi:hypothetical protein
MEEISRDVGSEVEGVIDESGAGNSGPEGRSVLVWEVSGGVDIHLGRVEWSTGCQSVFEQLKYDSGLAVHRIRIPGTAKRHLHFLSLPR